jgi:predicted AlkP superfamily pyrophosphatase or phosphodiesterase
LSPISLLTEKHVKPQEQLAQSGARKAARLVVLSADGLRPDFYRRPKDFRLKIPNILSLVESGASADAVESVYPTTSYPAHATLVTGVPPRVHGIYSHLASLDPTEKARPWCWFAQAIRVPTLWDVARAARRKTAAIGWPVSAGAAIDHNIPEIWDPAAPDPHRDLQTAARHSAPGLFQEVLKVLQPLLPDATPDRLRSEAALYVWQHFRPDLLLVHFVHYDQLAHKFGPTSPEALAAVEQMDKEIGGIRTAVGGDQPGVKLVVLSDHGFVPVEKEAAPLVALTEEGLLARGADGVPKLNRLGAVHAGGSFAVYWLEEPTAEDRSALERAVKRLCQTGAVREVLDRQRLESLAADPDAELALDAATGYYFSDRLEGPVVQASVKDRGTHGHLPSRPGMEAGFIAVGPGITPGKNLGLISLTQVAPTLARELGLPTGILASEERPLDLA